MLKPLLIKCVKYIYIDIYTIYTKYMYIYINELNLSLLSSLIID
jgi:hypothetical protein